MVSDNYKIIKLRKNSMAQRIEMIAYINTSKEINHNRETLTNIIKKNFKFPIDHSLVIQNIKYIFGGQKVLVNCNIYNNINSALKFERKRILFRNKLLNKPKYQQRRVLKEKRNKLKQYISLKKLEVSNS
uniref:Ribosomal protein S24 n=1 Tax=Amorphochlora amoebiformis TaxID=1561963 RepID=A0A0H5BLG2_9EUKA|nr:ribosomal protein S24 [Amorphochlora amoebiformis]|mmetsp:Transcript_18166/g.28929  ORF Transcript_18166/g.28929 Transcript_18166/m.28929 type:complete len:130 (+) Transcript_18166:383-772(+)